MDDRDDHLKPVWVGLGKGTDVMNMGLAKQIGLVCNRHAERELEPGALHGMQIVPKVGLGDGLKAVITLFDEDVRTGSLISWRGSAISGPDRHTMDGPRVGNPNGSGFTH